MEMMVCSSVKCLRHSGGIAEGSGSVFIQAVSRYKHRNKTVDEKHQYPFTMGTAETKYLNCASEELRHKP